MAVPCASLEGVWQGATQQSKTCSNYHDEEPKTEAPYHSPQIKLKYVADARLISGSLVSVYFSNLPVILLFGNNLNQPLTICQRLSQPFCTPAISDPCQPRSCWNVSVSVFLRFQENTGKNKKKSILGKWIWTKLPFLLLFSSADGSGKLRTAQY